MDYFIGFVILLGVLIFIHEFGHFIIAKACKIRVETFSIGMGKKILKFRRGETEYALSLLPLGGYVKLTGQDPREEVPAELETVSFRHKPLWKRAAVVLAGPFFNAALAVIILTGLYAKGVPAPAPVIERVLAGSPAEEAGFRTRDEILQIRYPDGRSSDIHEYADVESLVGDAVGTPLEFAVRRPIEGGTFENVTLTYTPVLGMDRDSTIGVMKQRGIIPGVERRSPAPVVALANSSAWAGHRGLPTGFWIEEMSYTAGAQPKTVTLERMEDLEREWARAAQAAPEAGQIVVKGHKVLPADGKEAKSEKADAELPVETYTLAWTSAGERPPATLEAAGLASAELIVLEIKEGSPADKLGLKVGDLIDTLNGKKVQSFMSFKDAVQDYAAHAEPLKLGWLREGQRVEAEVRPEMVSTRDPMTEAKKNQFQIGAAFMALQAQPPMTTVKASGFSDAVRLGVVKSYALTASMLSSFYHLIRGDISPKTLGGPILIGKIAGESFRQGYVAFFRMMAFISLNLFILNLFPIPILDGGHLILYCIEAIRRRPLSIKVIEAWTTAGFFLLMGLVVVVFLNDLSRLGVFKFFSS